MVADRARCPVWELEDAPSWWVDRLLIAVQAENRAAEERAIRDERRRKSQARTTGGRRR